MQGGGADSGTLDETASLVLKYAISAFRCILMQGMVQCVLTMCAFICDLFVDTKVYRFITDPRYFVVVVDKCKADAKLTLRTVVLHNIVIPTICVSWSFIMQAETIVVGLDADMDVVVTVRRWRWLGPIVPLPVRLVATDSTISVMNTRRANRHGEDHEYMIQIDDESYMYEGVPPQVVEDATYVASEIVRMFKERKCRAFIVVLSGRPGCGKTTTPRIIAKLLEGRLYPDYDCTSKKHSMDTIMDWVGINEPPTIIVDDEFEGGFKKIMKGEEAATMSRNDDNTSTDACNKKTYNGLVDKFKRKVNVMWIKTTNCSRDELAKLADPSMLREGRLDMWIDFDEMDPNHQGRRRIKIPLPSSDVRPISDMTEDDNSSITGEAGSEIDDSAMGTDPSKKGGAIRRKCSKIAKSLRGWCSSWIP